MSCKPDFTILPAHDFLDQEDSTSFSTTFSWTLRMKFKDFSTGMCAMSKRIILPIAKDQVFSLFFLKESTDSFSFHLQRANIDPLIRFEPLSFDVIFFLVGGNKPPIKRVLAPNRSGVSAFYQVTDLTNGKENVVTDWTIMYTIHVKEYKSPGQGIKFTLYKEEDKNVHITQMRSDMDKLLTSDTCNDITIEGTHVYPAHIPILVSSSQYFSEIFRCLESGRMKIFNIEDSVVRTLLRYIYTKRIFIGNFNVESILTLADVLKFPELVTKCLQFLRYNLTPDNVLKAYKESHVHEDDDLKHRAKIFIEEFRWKIDAIEFSNFLYFNKTLYQEFFKFHDNYWSVEILN